jgi:DNA-binding IclR family transcriptional regulator
LSADVRIRHRLGGASTVQRALAALVRDDVVTRDGDRYSVVDSLLREWVARQTF